MTYTPLNSSKIYFNYTSSEENWYTYLNSPNNKSLSEVLWKL